MDNSFDKEYIELKNLAQYIHYGEDKKTKTIQDPNFLYKVNIYRTEEIVLERVIEIMNDLMSYYDILKYNNSIGCRDLKRFDEVSSAHINWSLYKNKKSKKPLKSLFRIQLKNDLNPKGKFQSYIKNKIYNYHISSI